MHSSSTRLRRTGVGAAIAAVVGSGLLFTPAAHAADKVIPSNLVDLRETRATGHNDFGDDGIRVWTESNGTTDKAAGYFDVNKPLADVGEPSMDWSKVNNNGGSNLKPSVQLKTDFDGDGTFDGILVGESKYADGSNLYGDNWWLSNGSSQFVKDGAPSHAGGYGSTNNGTLAQWRVAFPNARVLEGGWSLGSGVKGDGFIGSITIGDTYYFEKAPTPEKKVLYKTDVDLSLTRATAKNDFRPTSGVRVYTTGTLPENSSTNKAAGYFDVNMPLKKVGLPVFKHRNTSGSVPGNQLVVDLDGNGTIDGTLVDEPIVPGIWWLSGSTIEGQPVAQAIKDRAPRAPGSPGVPGYSVGGGTPSEWRNEFPNAVLVKGGWSLGSGAVGDGVIESITYGDTIYTFTGKNRLPVAEDATATTRAGDAVDVTLSATDADLEAITFSTDDTDSEIVGNVLTYTPADGFDGEKTIEFTATDAHGGEDTGTVTVTVAANQAPEIDETVIGARQGDDEITVDLSEKVSDPEGDAVEIAVTPSEGVTVDGTTVSYTPAAAQQKVIAFTATDDRGAAANGSVVINVTANAAPAPEDRSVSTATGTSVTTTLPAEDGEGDELEYESTTPGATFVGNKLTVVVAKTAVPGARAVSYKVTDGRGEAVTGQVIVNVTKANSGARVALSPAAPKKGQKVTATVTVTTTGWSSNGIVEVFSNGKRLGWSRVAANGKAVVPIGAAKKGTHKINAIYRGTAFTNPATSPIVTITVK